MLRMLLKNYYFMIIFSKIIQDNTLMFKLKQKTILVQKIEFLKFTMNHVTRKQVWKKIWFFLLENKNLYATLLTKQLFLVPFISIFIFF